MRSHEETTAIHAASTDFAVRQLVPALLERLGHHSLAASWASPDRQDDTAYVLHHETDAVLRSQQQRLADASTDAPSVEHAVSSGDAYLVRQAVTHVRDMEMRWRWARGLNEFQLRDGQGESHWRDARRKLRDACRGVAHLCDTPLAHRVRLLAANVEWDQIDEGLWGLDDCEARRLCDLAEAHAFCYNEPSLVAAGAQRISDEACTLACSIISTTGVWVRDVLDTAATVPLAQLHGTERLYRAIVSRPDRRNLSRQQAFLDARDAAASLDTTAAELAARLVTNGLAVGDAVNAARAATAA